MAGTRTVAAKVATLVTGYSSVAVTAGLYLCEQPLPFPCRLTAAKVNAATAGTGAGNTVVDLLVNGASVWNAGHKPTLSALSTGEFTNSAVDRPVCKAGDVLAWTVLSISSTGHARLGAAVALERA